MKTFPRLTAALATVLLTVALPVAAFAQVFEKVRGPATDEVPAGRFVAIAYGFIWVAILTYVVFIARGVGRVRAELDDVRRKIDAANKR
jgi:CcmD family protein